MREAFKAVADMLRNNHVKPGEVELVIQFRNKSDRDKIAFAIGKEHEGFKRVPGVPGHVYAGDFYGIAFKLREPEDA
jgi:hypothetical protein